MFSDQAFSRLRKKREVEDALYLCIAKKKSNERRRTYARFRKCAFKAVWFGQKMSSVIVAVFNRPVGGHFEQTFDWRLSNVSTNGGLNPENFEKYIPKVVLAHVYQRSAAYGYFLRRVEKRYNVRAIVFGEDDGLNER